MPRRPPITRRWLTAATWPLGIVLTSWDYLWRTTPMHRLELVRGTTDQPPSFPPGVSKEDIQLSSSGAGPLFHRIYRTRIRDCRLTAEQLMEAILRDPNAASPTTFARFQRVVGDGELLLPGDELVVRMPGPWDGPVRVEAVGPCSFRLATHPLPPPAHGQGGPGAHVDLVPGTRGGYLGRADDGRLRVCRPLDRARLLRPQRAAGGSHMLLKLQALGVVHRYAGVRVGEVYEKTVERGGRQARVWGWNDRTLSGHVEMGEMSWEVWRWLHNGHVEFRVHSVSRPAQVGNPIVRLGFHLLRGHERRAFLDSTREQMRTFTELAVKDHR